MSSQESTEKTNVFNRPDMKSTATIESPNVGLRRSFSILSIDSQDSGRGPSRGLSNWSLNSGRTFSNWPLNSGRNFSNWSLSSGRTLSNSSLNFGKASSNWSLNSYDHPISALKKNSKRDSSVISQMF